MRFRTRRPVRKRSYRTGLVKQKYKRKGMLTVMDNRGGKRFSVLNNPYNNKS